MLANVITACLVIVGLINFAPVAGVFSARKLESAYAIDLVSNDLVILMRHRALMFGVVGGFILFAAFAASWQGAAMVMAAVSMGGYLVLALLVGDYNSALLKVLVVDVVGLVFLVAAAVLKYLVLAG